MTCKDCIHYDVCTNSNNDHSLLCEHFAKTQNDAKEIRLLRKICRKIIKKAYYTQGVLCEVVDADDVKIIIDDYIKKHYGR